MSHLVKRAFKYRFYPTDEQAEILARTLGCVRLVYNKALQERTTAWALEQRRVNYVESSAMLTSWKQTDELAFLNDVSSVPLQQALRHLQGAFVAFWDKRARYPRFKSRKKGKQSAEYTASAFRYRDGTLTLAKMREPLAVTWSRPLPDGRGSDDRDRLARRGRTMVRLAAVRRADRGTSHRGRRDRRRCGPD